MQRNLLSTMLLSFSIIFTHCLVASRWSAHGLEHNDLNIRSNLSATADIATSKHRPKVVVNLLYLTNTPISILQQRTFQDHLNVSVKKPPGVQDAAVGRIASPESIPWLANEQLEYVEVYTLLRDTEFSKHFDLQRTMSTVWNEIVNSTANDRAGQSQQSSAETLTTSGQSTFHMILGPDFSMEVKTISPITTLYNLITLSGGATSATLSDTARYPYFFRTCPTDGDAPNVLTRVIKKFGYDQVSILFPNQTFAADVSATTRIVSAACTTKYISLQWSSFSRAQLRDTLEPKFRDQNIRIENSLAFDPSSFSSAATVANILSVASSHGWVLVVSFNQYNLLCTLVKFGQISGATHAAFIYTPISDEQWWLPPADAEQQFADNHVNCTIEEIYSLIRGSLLVTTSDYEVLDKPDELTGLKPSQFHHDMEAAALQNGSLSYGQSKNSFASSMFTQFDAITAAALALDRAEYVMQTTYNSSLTYFHYNDSRVLQTVYAQLSNLSFDGLTGPVEFDSDGDRSGISWSIQQFQNTHYVEVGQYSELESGAYNLSFYNPLQFSTSDKQIPPQFPTKFSTTNIILVCLLAACLLAALIGIVYFYEKHRLKRLTLLSDTQNINSLIIDQTLLIPAEYYKKQNKLMASQASSNFSHTPTTLSLQSVTSGSTANVGADHLKPYLSFVYENSSVGLFPLALSSESRVGFAGKKVATSVGLIDLEFVRAVSVVLACSKQHENLASLIGLAQMTYADELHRAYVIMSGAHKGCLSDFLAHSRSNGQLFDNMSPFVILKDLQEGLAVVHKKFGFHGNLSSLICLVDNRLTLCISDYGLVRYRQAFFDEPDLDYSSWLWCAPELLTARLADKQREPPGNLTDNDSPLSTAEKQQCDVYSFGIIAAEIFSQHPPLGGAAVFSDEIQLNANLLLLKNIEADPGKADTLIAQVLENTDHGFNSADSDLYNLCKRCVAGNAVSRPSLAEIGTSIQAMMKSRKLSGNLTEMLLKRLETYATNLESVIEQRTQALQDEENKVRRLLYQILPQSVADELKNGNSVLPQTYESVTVFFSDIVDFTVIAAESTPLQVVDLLNDLYGTFDQITSQFEVYKVETIGDSYMVVSGLPTPNGLDHVWHIVRMSLALIDHVVETFKIRHRPHDQLRLRIGLHTGPCAAGVVGFVMPRYCLFGDTVNTAARMESSGEALRIHASEATALAMRKLTEYYGAEVSAYQFAMEERGFIEIKGKGSMRTFWVTKAAEV